MVSLAGLRAIEALATHGSMTAAASALGYTPSAVSQQISRLERDVREVLIERNGRRATLTAAGRVLADSASRIIMELETMNAQLQAQSQTVTGTLRIAAFATAARGIVPAAMRSLLEQWPSLDLHLIEVDSHRALELAARGSVDLAIAHDWEQTPLVLPEGLQSRYLGNDISDVLVYQDHPLASRETVTLDELLDESWLYEPGSVAHDLLLQAFDRTPISFTHVVKEYASQIEMIGAGLGTGLVPRMGRGALPSTVRVLCVDPPPVRRVYGVWRSSTGRRPALAEALIALATACSGEGE